MPYTFIPQANFLRINGDVIELVYILDDDQSVSCTMTAEEARSNANDLMDAADKLEGKGRWAP